MSLKSAQELDAKDSLKSFRNEFVFPQHKKAQNQLYFAGHSLGLMPKKAREYIDAELDSWGTYGVEGHFKGDHPWLPYHENLTASFARLVGGKNTEVVAMNSLTVNLHLLMVSFYRPTKNRYKILIEKNTFPSDKYVVDSQARFHGFNPKDAIVELADSKNLEEQISKLGDSLALVLLGNCNYLSGECFSFEKVVKSAHKVGAIAGFNLAHGAGNLHLKLHEWNVDFAVWCSYKYLNAGPGAIAGAFVHENHHGKNDIPRFEGWWGHNKDTRFKMPAQFEALDTVEAWQLSNPPIFQLASLRASMELFDKATMVKLRAKGDQLTSYLESQLKENLDVEIVTPSLPNRGSMLCLRFKNNPKSWHKKLHELGVIVDFREPDIIRIAPAPIYNSFEDVYRLVQILKDVSHG